VGATAGAGKLRIIGGEWRGRKLPIASLAGLRPSTDRIRETLFNWLAPDIVGRNSLDLFAGTGALGLEALSRGAAQCLFVEYQKPAAALLQSTLDTLGATGRASVLQADALKWISRADTDKSYDLLFLDPPFGEQLLESTASLLTDHSLVARDALVYVEYSRDQHPTFPANWERHRSKRTGGVIYELYHCA
jgi:16S rRNA (guanine966-N2)-methyltransferase